MAVGSRKAGLAPRCPKSSAPKTNRFFVHCAGRRDTTRLSTVDRSVSAWFVMGNLLCAMRGSRVAGRAPGLLEAGERFLFRVVRLEHGEELRDCQKIRDPLGQVEQLELAPLAADGGVRADDLAEAR